MKYTIFLLLIITSSLTHGHYKKNKPAFLVNYKAGLKWDHKTSFKKQKNIGEHIIHVKNLYHQGHIKFGANSNKKGFGVYVFEGTASQLKKKLNADPSVQKGLISFDMEAITLTMQKKHRH